MKETADIKKLLSEESIPRLKHLVLFWIYSFKTTKTVGYVYLAVVLVLAGLRPALALVWSAFIRSAEVLGSNGSFFVSLGFVSAYFLISFLINTITRYTETNETIERLDIVYAGRMREKTQSEMFEKLSKVTPEYFEIAKMNDKVQQVFDGVSDPYFGLGDTVMRRGYIIVGKVISIITTALALYLINPWLTFVVLIAPTPAFVTGYVAEKSRFLFSKQKTQTLRKMEYFQRLMSTPSAKELYIFNAHNFIYKKWKKLADTYVLEEKQLYIKTTMLNLFGTLISSIAVVAGYIIALIVLSVGYLSFGMLGAAWQLIGALSGDVTTFILSLSSIVGKKNEAAQFNDFINLQHDTEGTQKIFELEKIEFRGVWYRYPESDDYVLKDINLVIERGESISIVGENGAGKSTFIKLLTKQISPTKGIIFVNGIPLESICGGVVEKTATVSQSPAKYETMTVSENVYIGDTSSILCDKAIDKALEFADISEVDKNSTLGKSYGGTDLSGGQWQKLAIARASFRNKNFVILDEPTGNLDPISEAKLFSKYIEFSAEKTVIYVTHRISAAALAENIVVFNDGHIVERGTQEDLLSLKGVYYHLHQEQATWYQR
ncbi:MAG: ABC transporter ATP-binding protein/permease [Oscillospiraceae bacterium]|nr:ABC transporter ATP-binding protein/permease [Oscillospiraceae bacterium]MCL2278915.1 ABC transporter ATP-binding protein/permease [Oscillospiraceae bacterium]